MSDPTQDITYTIKIIFRYETSTLYGQAFIPVLLIKIMIFGLLASPNVTPYPIKPKATYTVFMVWALPCSLVTTKGISF